MASFKKNIAEGFDSRMPAPNIAANVGECH